MSIEGTSPKFSGLDELAPFSSDHDGPASSKSSTSPRFASGLDIRSRTKEGMEDLKRLVTNKKKADRRTSAPGVCVAVLQWLRVNQ